MEKPCSIIIPTFNRSELLVRAVESALAALPDDGELIVVDDGSDTPAQAVLGDVADPRLQVLQSGAPRGGGGSPSRNKGAKTARGRVLFFLDDDDELLPDYCKSILASDAMNVADFGFCARKFKGMNEDGELETTLENRRLSDGPVSTDEPFSKRTFPFSAGFWIKKSAFEKAGNLAENLSTNSDTEYCCRLYGMGLSGWYASTPGVVIHEHTANNAQMTNVTKRTKAADRAASFRFIAEEHKEFLKSDPSAASFIHKRWLRYARRAGQAADPRQAVAAAPNPVLRATLSLQRAGLDVLDSFKSKTSS